MYGLLPLFSIVIYGIASLLIVLPGFAVDKSIRYLIVFECNYDYSSDSCFGWAAGSGNPKFSEIVYIWSYVWVDPRLFLSNVVEFDLTCYIEGCDKGIVFVEEKWVFVVYGIELSIDLWCVDGYNIIFDGLFAWGAFIEFDVGGEVDAIYIAEDVDKVC